MMKEKKKFQPMTSEEISQVYSLLHKEGLVAFPYTNASRNKLEALVSNINGRNFDVSNYETTEEKIIAYLYFLIKNHLFTDGNKRTATLIFLILCDVNNITPKFRGVTLDALVIALEQLKAENHQKVIKDLAEALF